MSDTYGKMGAAAEEQPYDIGEPDVEDIIIELKSGRTVVMTIGDEDGVAQFGFDAAVSLRDWLNRAIEIMSLTKERHGHE